MYKVSWKIFAALLAGLIAINQFYPVPGMIYAILSIAYITLVVIGVFNIQMNFFLKSYCRGSIEKKEIALSFDDGPNTQFTPQLLDILSENNIIATFFCIGEKINKQNSLVKKIDDQGHFIGNHSFSHSVLFDFKLPSRMLKEINATNESIYKAIGKKPRFFRPPFGITNSFLARALEKTNMISIGWSLRSLDTVKKQEKVLKRIKRKIHPGDIILLHDTSEKTLNVVRELISWLKTIDYKIVGLDKLLAEEAYEAD